MSDGLELDPSVREAVNRVRAASASEPGTDRFREQLRNEIANVGGTPTNDLLDAIVEAIRGGTYSQYG